MRDIRCPKGWQDIGESFYYRELKSGPEYLCKYCGEVNDTRHPRHHRAGCPKDVPPHSHPAKAAQSESGHFPGSVQRTHGKPL